MDIDDGRVEWKDVVYDAAHGLGVRMYRPAATGGAEEKLPVVVYFHGGGFCIGSCTWPNFHAGCLRLAAELPAVVLSFDYRLAPEHRLPAAHEDAAAALIWLRDQLLSDPWLADTRGRPAPGVRLDRGNPPAATSPTTSQSSSTRRGSTR